MPGEFDEKVALDVVKDSMGLSDADLAPEDSGDLEADLGSEDFEGSSDQVNAQEDRVPRGRQDDEHEAPTRTPPQERQRGSDPLRQNTLRFDPRASFHQDRKGNLIDSRTGEIIARSGSEARIYQRVHKEASDYIQAATRNIQNQMASERGKLERAVEIGLGFEKSYGEAKAQLDRLNAYGLQPDQLLEAGQIYKQAQSDPVGVLKSLLTRAALSGIDITQLGMPAGGIDAAGIADMVRREIQSAVKPVNDYTAERQRREQENNTQSQYLRQAETQVNSFFNNTPEAQPYLHVFHAVLSQPQFQQMSLGAIWDKIQLHLMRNGVDPSRPPSRSQRQRLSGTPDARSASRSLPNGQGMAPSGGDRRASGNAGPAHPSMSYDAIIREVLGQRS